MALPMQASSTPIEPPFSWTGFYLGANGGGGSAWSDFRGTQTTPFGPTAFCCGFGLAGDIIGGQAGFNYEFPSHWVIGIEETAIGPTFHVHRAVAQYSQEGLSPALPPDAQQITSQLIASRPSAAVWATRLIPAQVFPRVRCYMVLADGHGANYQAITQPPAWAGFVQAPPFPSQVAWPPSMMPLMVGRQVPGWKSRLRGIGLLGLRSFTCSSTTLVLISIQSPLRQFLERAQRRPTFYQTSTLM